MSEKPFFVSYLERWSKINIAAHEQERSAREEYSTDVRKWQEEEIASLTAERDSLAKTNDELSEALTKAINATSLAIQQAEINARTVREQAQEIGRLNNLLEHYWKYGNFIPHPSYFGFPEWLKSIEADMAERAKVTP